jgi:hypothetical protein
VPFLIAGVLQLSLLGYALPRINTARITAATAAAGAAEAAGPAETAGRQKQLARNRET